MTKNILLTGIGGQGTILTGKILTLGLLEAGYDVKMSEIHGMSQRGGSVTTQIRFGEHVESPIIGRKSTDIMIAFEKMEALRNLPYMKKDGCIILDDCEIPSMSVISGKEKYAGDITQKLSQAVTVKTINASALACQLGNKKASNMILLGALINKMHLENIDWEDLLEKTIKPAFWDINTKALGMGMAVMDECSPC